VLQGGTCLANEGDSIVTAGFRVHVCEKIVQNTMTTTKTTIYKLQKKAQMV
jgi:hypothetical protein